MSQNDVELIIRARNEASQVFSELSDSVNSFIDDNKSASAQALESDQNYQKLKQAYEELAQAMSGLQQASIAGQALADAGVAAEKAGEQFLQSSNQVDNFVAEQNSVSGALDRTNAALNETGTYVSQYGSEIKQLTEVRKQLGADKKLIGSLKKEQNTWKDLQNEYAQTRTALDKAFSRKANAAKVVDQLTSSIQKHKKSLDSLVTKYGESTKWTKAQKDEAATLRAEYKFLTDQLKRANKELSNSASDFSRLEQSSQKVSSSMQKTSTTIGELKTKLSSYGAEVDDVNAAESKRVSNLAKTNAAIAQNNAKLVESKAYHKSLQSEVSRLTSEKARLASQIGKAAVANDKANQKYNETKKKLGETADAAKRAGIDINKLASEQARLKNETSKTAEQLSRAKKQTRDYSNAVRSASKSTNKAAKSMELWGEKSRKSMSVTQRMRGEMLSLATAYLGFYNAINQIDKALDSYMDKEAAVARFTAVLGDNTAAVAAEFKYVGEVADELKLPLTALEKQYSKLFVVMKQQGAATEDVRTIFHGVAVGARTMKMSVDDVNATFRALTQIYSKNKVMAEELTQQLGDRFPAATVLMAKSLKITTAELYKMMEGGEVSATALIGFAKQIETEYSRGLPTALASLQAQFTELGTSVTRLQRSFGETFAGEIIDDVKELNEALKSDEAREFAKDLATGMGVLIDGVRLLIENWDILLAMFKTFAAIKIAKVFGGIHTSVVELIPKVLSLKGGMGGLTKNVSAAASAFGVLMSAMAGWEIGNWLNQFGAVRKVATGFIAALDAIALKLVLVTDLMAAPFNDDTFEAALDRYTEKMVIVEQIVVDTFKQIDEEVRKANKSVKESAEDVTKALTQQEIEAAKLKAAQDALIKSARTLSHEIMLINMEEKKGIITTEMAILKRNALADAFHKEAGQAELAADKIKSVIETYIESIEVAKKQKDIDKLLTGAKADLNTEIKEQAIALGEIASAASIAGQKIAAAKKKEELATLKTKAASDNMMESLIAIARLYRQGELTAKEYWEETKKAVHGADGEFKQIAKRFKEVEQAAKSETVAIDASNQSKMDAIKSAIKLAEAEGDTLEVKKLTIELAAQQVKASKEVAVALQKQADIAWRRLAVTKEQAKADGKVTEAEKKKIEQLEKSAKAQQKAADSAKNKVKEQKQELDIATKVERSTRSVAVSYEQMASKANMSAKATEYLNKTYQIFFKQFQNLMSSGAISNMTAYINNLNGVRDSAIRAAKSLAGIDKQMANLGQSGLSGLKDLQTRLLEIEGTEEQIARNRARREEEQLTLEIKKTQLEYRKASLLGDTDKASVLKIELEYMNQQLTVLSQIHSKERRKRKEDLTIKQQESIAATTPTVATSTTGAVSLQTVKIVKVEIGGKTVRVIEGDDELLLEALEDEGARS